MKTSSSVKRLDTLGVAQNVHPPSGGCACRYSSNISIRRCSMLSSFTCLEFPCLLTNLIFPSAISRKGFVQCWQIRTEDFSLVSIVSRLLRKSLPSSSCSPFGFVALAFAGLVARSLEAPRSSPQVAAFRVRRHKSQAVRYTLSQSPTQATRSQFEAVETVSG